ncbi:MAG: hypothetical protein AAF351_04510 [Pseudomonadota bacterium]
MLLRRVVEHVNAQNWFAVGIDFVIVVVGVFIGIQVANWNDAVAKQSVAERMQAGVLVDIGNEKKLVQGMREYWETTQAYAETAVIGFSGDPSIDDERFVVSAYQASQAIYPLSNRATYEQMVASGNISISGSDTLRLAIVSFYVSDWSQSPDNITVAPYRSNIRRAIPHVIQAAIRERCGDEVVPLGVISGLRLPKTCDIDVPADIVAETAANLRQRPDLLMDLRHQLSHLSAKLQNMDQLDLQIDQILELAGGGE